MDQEIRIESVESDCLTELKEEHFIKVENFPDVCEPKLERDESTLLEDPLNVLSDAQGPFLYKNEIKGMCMATCLNIGNRQRFYVV